MARARGTAGGQAQPGTAARQLAGRAGARLAGVLGLRVAKDTLLRLVRATPEKPVGEIRVLGVDDFALRKGDSYATILVDLERRRPVDVLPGRDAEPLATWLKGHPEVEIICRDRAGAYAEGARSGAPQAVQVADAWHLWHNLGEAVEKTVSAHHACVRTAFENAVPTALPASDDIWQTPPAPAAGMLDVCGRERRLVTRTRERYTAVRQLLDDGSTLEAICRTLQLDRSTVRRFARATSIDELLVKATPLPDSPQRRGALGWREAEAGVRETLAPLMSDPDTVRAADEIHRRLHTLGIRDRHVQAAMADLPLEDTAAARALGRHLTRTGTSTLTVNVGIALLARLGEPEDVPYLKILGLLRVLARPVAGALTALDCPTAALASIIHVRAPA